MKVPCTDPQIFVGGPRSSGLGYVGTWRLFHAVRSAAGVWPDAGLPVFELSVRRDKGGNSSLISGMISSSRSDTTKADRAMVPPHPLQNSKAGSQDAKQAPIRVLLCNPNSTAAMTENCVRLVQPTLPRDAEVIGFTLSSQAAPTAVEGFSDAAISAAEAGRQVVSLRDRYDAVLVACYSDHPLIKVLREELDMPIVGIMEASLFVARTLGGRFGILGTCEQLKVSLEDAVRQYGFAGYCAGVASCGLGVLELKTRPEEEVIQTMCDVARDLVARGADTLTLGCSGMINLQPTIQNAVGENIQVIDGVVAGVQHLIGIVRMGCKTAKSGVYSSAAIRRQARGQLFF